MRKKEETSLTTKNPARSYHHKLHEIRKNISFSFFLLLFIFFSFFPFCLFFFQTMNDPAPRGRSPAELSGKAAQMCTLDRLYRRLIQFSIEFRFNFRFNFHIGTPAAAAASAASSTPAAGAAPPGLRSRLDTEHDGGDGERCQVAACASLPSQKCIFRP